MELGLLPSVLGHLGGGHWYEYILYAIPITIVVGSVLTSVIRERRRDDDEADSEEAERE